MKRLGLVGLTIVAVSAAQPLGFAQQDVLKPFTTEDGVPVRRAQPVERPVATPIPAPPPVAPPIPAPPAVPASTPIPVDRATPISEKVERPERPTTRPKTAPKPGTTPPKATPVPQPEIPDPTGEIRLAPSGTSLSADQMQLRVADNYYAKQMFEMAAPEYEKYLGLYVTPADRPTALFRLAESYRRIGTINAAKNTYEMLLSEYGNGEFIGPASYRLADLYYQERNYSAALPMFRKASVRLKDPRLSNMAKFYTGRTLEGMGNKLDARIVYEDLVASPNENPFLDASRLSLAVLLKESGRTAEALKQIQAIQKTTENVDLKAEATVRAGLWQLELNQPRRAEADLQEALQMPAIGRWKDVAQLGLLQLKFNEGKYKEIVEVYGNGAEAVSADSRPQFLVILGNAYRQLGRHEEALKLYDQLAKEAPNTVFAKDAAYERIVSLYQLEPPDLLAQLDQYLLANSDATKRDQVLLMKAELLFKKQDFAAAAPVYEMVANSRQLIGNYRAKALYKFGWCALQTKENDKAIRGFTELITRFSISDSVGPAYFYRGVAKLRNKDLPGALKDFNDVLAKYPKIKERESALEQKAVIQGQQNDNKGMAETYRVLLKDFPKSAAAADANYWIGWVAYEAKNYPEVVAPLSAARQLDKEKYFERASLRILLSHFYLEHWDAVGREIDLYTKSSGKAHVPDQVMRGVGMHFFDLGERAEKPEARLDHFAAAAKYLTLLTKREDAKSEDFFNLGRSNLRLGKYQEAAGALVTYLKDIKEPAPRCEGLLALSEAAIGLRDFDAAQKSVDEALKLQSEGRLNALAIIAHGDIYMGRGKVEEAAKDYEKASIVMDDEEFTPRALEKAIEAYRQSGNDVEAKRLLNTLQSRYPEYVQRKKQL